MVQCFCSGAVFLWWCFCGGVVVFLWWCFCGGVGVVVFFCVGVFFGGVGVVVFLWWCWCGGVFVVRFLWWCGGVLDGVLWGSVVEECCREV